MAIGCIICAEAFSTADPADKHPMAIKNCGHAFHSACLKTWLSKSRTCPICRSICSDSSVYLNRLHLQSVNNLDSSTLNEPGIENILRESVMCAKDQEIAELHKQLAETRSTLEKVRGYFSESKKLNRHIEIELGMKPHDDSVIDLSNSPTLPPPPVPAATASTARIISRTTAASRPTSAALHRPTTTISSRVRQLAARGRIASSASLNSSRTAN